VTTEVQGRGAERLVGIGPRVTGAAAGSNAVASSNAVARSDAADGLGATIGRRRLAIQITSVTLFLACFALAATGLPERLAVPVDLYFLSDPLLVLTASLTAGAFLVLPLVAAGVVLSGTVVLGRVFCGYLCPLGACLDWTAPRGAKRRKAATKSLARWRWVKHALLAVLVIAAAAGIPAAYLFDPLAILWRALALLAYPLALAASGLGLGGARQLLDAVTSTTPLAFSVPHRVFAGAALSGALLGVILLLNRVAPRFWCRTACPLGAVLSIAGRRPWLRRRLDRGTCLACTKCRAACPMGALAERPDGSVPTECLVCLRCAESCPTASVSIVFEPPGWARLRRAGSGGSGATGPSAPAIEDLLLEDMLAPAAAQGAPPAPDHAARLARLARLDRRRFLGAAACGLGGVLVADRVAWPATRAATGTLRPPGCASEEELLDRCVRCGVCMQACPTNVIQPDVAPGAFAGFFAPALVMRLGGCDPECTRCGEVCPTGAIPELSRDEKKAWVLGTAVVEPDRCLRTARDDGGEDCRACVEVCPYEAFERGLAPGQAPRLIADRCTGCGLCEFRCPVPPRDGSRRSRREALGAGRDRRAAIYVLTAAEAARLAPTLEERAAPRDDSYLPPFLRTS